MKKGSDKIVNILALMEQSHISFQHNTLQDIWLCCFYGKGGIDLNKGHSISLDRMNNLRTCMLKKQHN